MLKHNYSASPALSLCYFVVHCARGLGRQEKCAIDVRLFIGVPIENQVRANIYETVRRLFPDISLRWVMPENYHITLKFLGQLSSEMIPEITKALTSIAAEQGGFSIKLAGLGAFPNLHRPKIWWVGAADMEDLAFLAKRVDSAMTEIGLLAETKNFVAHLTVARVKGPARTLPPSVSKVEFGNSRVREVILYESRGMAYHPVATIPLKT